MTAPFAWTDKIEETFLERLAGGEVVEHILKDPKMPNKSALHRRRTGDPAFLVRYNEARKEQMRAWADEIVSLADDAREDWVVVGGTEDEPKLKLHREHIARTTVRIDTRKWLMARVLSAEYGDKSTVDVNHNIKSMDDEELHAQIRTLLEQFGLEESLIAMLMDLLGGK